MQFRVLATDFDGTIATDGRLDPEVRSAIAEVRALGIVVVIVTGRILADLDRVAGSLTFVDGIVAENGAVLSIPGGAPASVIGAPPPPDLVATLRKKGIRIEVGASIIEADALTAPTVVETIRTLEVPRVVIFNRDRLMALPSGVNKATGLQAALKILHLSARHTMGIGDAENDHDLLDACGFGVAVGWGSDALKARADDVIPGGGPTAVAGYLRAAAKRATLPPKRRPDKDATRPGTPAGDPAGR